MTAGEDIRNYIPSDGRAAEVRRKGMGNAGSRGCEDRAWLRGPVPRAREDGLPIARDDDACGYSMMNGPPLATDESRDRASQVAPPAGRRVEGPRR